MNEQPLISHPLVILLAAFLLSLLATWILFRFLKSNATVIQPKWRAGGAIAGFILLFGMTFSFADSWLTKYIYATRRFNISGTVTLDQGYFHDGTTVEEMPPAAYVLTAKDGSYTLPGIRYDAREISEVTVAFAHENFIPVKHTFGSAEFTVDWERLQISIRDTVRLRRAPKEISEK
ncbi:MAG: hypothetical protein WCI71_09015 [Bacteroidota bacterium]